MKPFTYQAPDTVREAVTAVAPMAPAGEGGAFLAGGTTILDLMKLTVVSPPSLTDVRKLGLDRIARDGDMVRLGARVTMARAADHPMLKQRAPVLSEALWKAASPQLRNVATPRRQRAPAHALPVFPRQGPAPATSAIRARAARRSAASIGSLAVLGTSEHCIANYPGDFANALILFDAVVETAGRGRGTPDRVRSDPCAAEEPSAARDGAEDDELITGFRLTVPDWARRSRYVKIRDRDSYAFALTSAAVALDMDGDTVREARLGHRRRGDRALAGPRGRGFPRRQDA